MIEVLKLALRALDYASYKTEPEGDLNCNCLICQATVAVKEAILDAEKQEPVAWMWLLDGQVWDLCSVKDRFQQIRDGHIQMPLYTHPQPKQPLTDDEIAELWLPIYASTPPSGIHEDGLMPWRLARAIEAAHGIKGET